MYAYKASISGNEVTFNITFGYKQTQEQERYVEAEVKRIIASQVTSNMSVHEKIKTLHDYVVRNVAYDQTMNQAINAPYFALTQGKTLCNGYAMLMYRLLNEVGIETRLISGQAHTVKSTVGHAWNLVKVDGSWYHLDVTWDDPVPDKGDNVDYHYYMLTDEQIAQDHTWKDGGLNNHEKPYPTATANYFEQLIADEQYTILKEIGQFVPAIQLVKDEQQFRASLRYQMDRLRPRVEIMYTGNDADMIQSKLTKFVNEENTGVFRGEYSYYAPLKTTYQNNVVTYFKYDFPQYSVDIKKIEVDHFPATIAVGDESQLMISMERTDGKVLDVSEFAEVKAVDPSILKVGHQKVTALQEGVTNLEITYNDERVTKQVVVKGNELAREIIPYPLEGYKSIGELTNISENKVWTVHVSQPITNDNRPTVAVINQYGEEIDVAIEMDGKKINVQPPNLGYIAGETYYLKVQFSNKKQNVSAKFTSR